MSFYRSGLLVSLALAGMIAGCGQVPGTSNGIAVMDLSAVARATGQDDVIRQRAEEGQEELMSQLQTLAASLDAKINAERDKAGVAPSEKDAARIQQLTLDARQQIAAAQQQAQQQAQQMQTDLVVEFRDALMPMAKEIATQKGLSVILSKDAYIFWAADTADITDAVVAAWQAQSANNDSAAEAEIEAVMPESVPESITKPVAAEADIAIDSAADETDKEITAPAE